MLVGKAALYVQALIFLLFIFCWSNGLFLFPLAFALALLLCYLLLVEPSFCFCLRSERQWRSTQAQVAISQPPRDLLAAVLV